VLPKSDLMLGLVSSGDLTFDEEDELPPMKATGAVPGALMGDAVGSGHAIMFATIAGPLDGVSPLLGSTALP